MRNRIEKSNKTKFDYRARVLGFIGIAIIAATFAIGGHTLLTISNENKALVNLIETPTNTKNHANKNDEVKTKENEKLVIVIEE